MNKDTARQLAQRLLSRNELESNVYYELKKALKEDSEELHNESVALQANSSFEYGALIGALFVLNHLNK